MGQCHEKEQHPHICISERCYGHSVEYEFEEDKTCAVDQEKDDECSDSKGKEKGQNSEAFRRNYQQNILTNRI